MTIGENLKTARTTKGISSTKLAECANVSHVMILRYESGQSVPNIITAYKIAKTLGITIDDIMKGWESV